MRKAVTTDRGSFRSAEGDNGRVRVLAINPGDGYWGAEQWLTELAPMLSDSGVDLILAAPPESAVVGEWSSLGLPWRSLELPDRHGLRHPDGSGRRPGLATLASDGTAVARSVVYLRRLASDVDVLHSNAIHSHLDVAAAGRLAGRPTVLYLHHIVAPGLGSRVLRVASRLATTTLANSSATAAPLGPMATRVQVIHPGVDLERFAPGPADPVVRRELGAARDELLVGVLGRIDPIKRIEDAIRALARSSARRDGARLVVVGSTLHGGEAYAAELEAEARRTVGDQVIFTGPRSDVPDVLRALDVVVSVNAAEPFGRSVLEAQASARPVVAADGGGIPDFVADGVTGLLIRPRDVDGLAAAIDRLASDADLRARLGRAGREQAEQRFGIAAQAERMAAAYRDAARRSRVRPA